MEKDTKIIFGTVLLLLLAMVSFNFFNENEITGMQTYGQYHYATFISQNVPTNVNPGQNFQVSITMQNLGTSDWTKNLQFKLGSQNPQDNLRWGLIRVELNSSESVYQGASKTFGFWNF